MVDKEKVRALFQTGKTYAAVGEVFGISRQRVQQIVRPPKDVYDSLVIRAKGKCEVCSVEIRHGHVHYKNPKAKRLNSLRNLQYLCPSCHLSWGMHPYRQGPYKPPYSLLPIGRRVE